MKLQSLKLLHCRFGPVLPTISKYRTLRGMDMDTRSNQNARKNRLASETSPYLLQHAENPVDWYPWGDEALSRAVREDKPIFLSIGYSACHWCHVMAHESFEDQEVAKIMNENFVSIKVDREERPDIDDIYQRVCQLASGTGGWPLSVFLSPDQKPFYVGTYFPKEGGRYGMPGFPSILKQLSDVYKNKRAEITAASSEFMEALSAAAKDIAIRSPVSQGAGIERSILDEGAVGLLHMGDNIYGGFGQAPKFPNPSNLMFLLRYFDLSGLGKFKDFVIFTADKMAMGGIHDHLGGGFARYSTDQKWLVPHFEKMLYDNALLAQLYAEIFQISKDASHLGLVNKTLEFLMREMTHPGGGLYSAQDADSEGEEGKFYTWSKKEIVSELGTDSDMFCEYFGVTEAGNFEGKNILNQRSSETALAQKYGMSPNQIRTIVEQASQKLFAVRENRIRPGRDEKVLTSWNGLAISAFAKGYSVTRQERYLVAARRILDFIDSKLTRQDNRLLHSFKDGQASQTGFLDDYAFYCAGLLDMFAVHSDPSVLNRAIQVTEAMITHFWDFKDGGFFFTADDHEKLIARTKNYYDLAVPSGNSVAAMNLLKIYHYTQKQDYLDKSTVIMRTGAMPAAENPFGFGQLLNAIYMYVKKPVEITLISNSRDSAMVNWLGAQYMPDSITSVVAPDALSELSAHSFFKGREIMGGETAYVCRNFACSLPLTNLEDLRKELRLTS